MKKTFDSNLFMIIQGDDSVGIFDRKKDTSRYYSLDDKDVLLEIAKCVELSSEIHMFDDELKKVLLEEDLEELVEGRYVLKKGNGKGAMIRIFTYHLMP